MCPTWISFNASLELTQRSNSFCQFWITFFGTIIIARLICGCISLCIIVVCRKQMAWKVFPRPIVWASIPIKLKKNVHKYTYICHVNTNIPPPPWSFPASSFCSDLIVTLYKKVMPSLWWSFRYLRKFLWTSTRIVPSSRIKRLTSWSLDS
jgi:hypothetical protein